MRAGPALRIEAEFIGAFESSRLGWLQAGFGSFAYRLAHLRASRPTVIGALSLLFFLS
ncbi:MAG: hypothetical protein ABI398_09835 [Devosia sp.]